MDSSEFVTNELGEQILIQLSNVIQKIIKTNPEDCLDILKNYSWSKNTSHFVTKSFSDEVEKMKK
eukprot:9610639-Ditylum_brightwellii.AAC.1